MISLTLNNILELDFDNTSKNLGFMFVNATNFETGQINLLAAGLRVRSNKNWTVSAKPNSANFSTTAGGDVNVSSNTLSVRRNGTTNTIALTTTDQNLTTRLKGGFGTNTFQLDYIANLRYTALTTYPLGVTYLVTAP